MATARNIAYIFLYTFMKITEQSLTKKPNSWRRVLLQKLTVIQLNKKLNSSLWNLKVQKPATRCDIWCERL